MTIRIPVEADVSGVQSELAKVDAAAKRINDTLASGAVGLDVAQAKRDLAELEAAAKSIVDRLSAAGGAEVDVVGRTAAASLQEAAQAAADLEKVLEAIGQSTGASRVVRNAKEQADHIHRAARAHEVLSREGIKLSRAQVEAAKASFDSWRRSGARGTSRIRDTEFDDWVSGGWRGHSIDQHEAERRRAEILRTVGVDLRGAGGAGALARGRSGALAGAAGGMLGSMLGGGDGGIAGAAGEAAGTGIGAAAGWIFRSNPIGMAVGAFASQLLGRGGAAIDQKMEQAGSEAAIFADLRRSVGVTRTEFDELRGSVRYFSEGLGLAYNESAQLAKEFARISNAREGGNIGREVGDAAGFARGFGADPAAAVRYMATMRHLGVSGNDTESRRLALHIGEAVQRGGTTAKMDEVLSVLQSQASNQARASLSAPEVGAMASFMSSLTGLSMYGMKGDPNSAGAAMSAADSAMRQGGAFGEASKNFSLGLWQRQLAGFTALDMDFMNEQGAFGNIGKAFGRDSAAYKLAEARGDRVKMAQYDQWVGQGGSRSVMAMQMQALEQYYGRNTDEFRMAIQSHFGVGAGQASALYQAYQNDRGLGDLERTLRDAGVDVDGLNSKQIAAVSEVAGSGKDGILKQADRLRKLDGADKLSKEDAAALERAASGGNDEEMRKVVIRLTAAYDSTRDQGEQMRQTQANMANSMQELATKLIPATLAIKDGIAALVMKLAPDSEFAKRDKAEKAAIEEYRFSKQGRKGWFGETLEDPNSPTMRDRREQALQELRRAEAGGWISQEGQRILDEERAAGGQGAASQGKHGDQAAIRQKILDEVKRQGGTDEDAAALLGLAAVESGFRQSARGPVIERGMHKGDRAAGVFQYMAKSSTGFDRYNEDENIAAGVRDFLKNKRRLGTAELAVAAHHAGPNHEDLLRGVIPGTSDGNMSTRRYVESVMRQADRERRVNPDLIAKEADARVPAGLRDPAVAGFGPQPVSLNVGGRFELYDQFGRELAQPIIQTFFGAPRPAGVFG